MTKFSRREYIGDIVLPTSGTATNIPAYNYKSSIVYHNPASVTNPETGDKFNTAGPIPINPDNPYMFPWLSQLAGFYEEFTIKSLVFDFVPTIGNANSTSALIGSVMLAYQPNALDDALDSKTKLLEQANSISVKTNQAWSYTVPLSKPFKKYFTNSSLSISDFLATATSTTQYGDAKTYFPGLITVATQGFSGATSGQQVGQLFVSYEIELTKEKFLKNDLW